MSGKWCLVFGAIHLAWAPTHHQANCGSEYTDRIRHSIRVHEDRVPARGIVVIMLRVCRKDARHDARRTWSAHGQHMVSAWSAHGHLAIWIATIPAAKMPDTTPGANHWTNASPWQPPLPGLSAYDTALPGPCELRFFFFFFLFDDMVSAVRC